MVLLSEFRKTFPGALKLRFPSRKKICRIFFWYKIECNSGNYWTSAFLFSVSETSDCWLEPAVKIFQLSGIPDEWQSEIATVLYVRTKNTRYRPSSMSEGVKGNQVGSSSSTIRNKLKYQAEMDIIRTVCKGTTGWRLTTKKKKSIKINDQVYPQASKIQELK